jgi:FHS family L-fucose permease-like MFS transporter
MGSLLGLLKFRAIRWKMVGIFLFVGSEMGMNTYLASHMWANHGMAIDGDAIRYGQGLFWLAEGVGRALGAVVLTWVSTGRFFLGCAIAGLLGLAGLILGGDRVAIASVALCGMTFANIWPCLFALTVAGSPRRASELGGLAVLANVGGAIMPGAMGLVADRGGVKWGFLVPVGAFLYLVALAMALLRDRSRS